jgi:hypothetical protein
MSNSNSFNENQKNNDSRFINTTKTKENSKNLKSIDYDLHINSNFNIEKQNLVVNSLLDSPFLTLQAKQRY